MATLLMGESINVMFFRRWILIILGLSPLLLGCSTNLRERQLRIREAELARRQEVFAPHALEYQSLLLVRDSLLKRKRPGDRPHWPETIEGIWEANIICSSSNDRKWIVGDRLSQTWQFFSNSTGIFVAVFDNQRCLRVLNGDFAGSTIHLAYAFDSFSHPDVALSVSLHHESTRSMPGELIFFFPENGKAIFSIKLHRGDAFLNL
ncbi:hypothetical protein [Dyadobacter fermentans]|uniref:hypothetical protein n=1 Tax=Dyadobacter fermentans TaxID=94254 RepID=UPI001CBE9BC8|nr:hypothetical protein [Dyadobacter fermentans]MBZ1362734.1 hypothetical protein [Dyadobacter fermentans]